MNHTTPYDLYSPIEKAPNFTLWELIKSDTASRLSIDNMPGSETICQNLIYLAQEQLQPARSHFGLPIRIHSGYRSSRLNFAIGGSATSFHSHGQAADISFAGNPKSYKDSMTSLWDLFLFFHSRGTYTELIAEELTPQGGGWIHIATARGRERENQLKYKLVGQPVRRGTLIEIKSIFGVAA